MQNQRLVYRQERFDELQRSIDVCAGDPPEASQHPVHCCGDTFPIILGVVIKRISCHFILRITIHIDRNVLLKFKWGFSLSQNLKLWRKQNIFQHDMGYCNRNTVTAITQTCVDIEVTVKIQQKQYGQHSVRQKKKLCECKCVHNTCTRIKNKMK